VAADVADESSVIAALEGIQAQDGRVDVLVNVVGGYMAGQPIHELDASTWDVMLTLNLRTAFLMSKHAARLMIPNNWGRIINFSARAARDTAANAGAYAVSKAGVLALTEVQAREVLAFHITVNAILPSIVDTPANRQAMPKADFARWPKAEEVARVVRFLASDDAALISGAGIPVYGQW
jgi:NAD(P)-dependent dehydrogenase (short-subunit alcohol dehydrogenase family)